MDVSFIRYFTNSRLFQKDFMRFIFFGLLFILSFSIKSQQDSNVKLDTLDEIALLSDVLINGFLEDTRAWADNRLNPLLEGYFQSNSIKECLFPDLPWLRTLFPQDSSFVILTWQYKVNDHQYKYRGIIKNETGTFRLEDKSVDFNFLMNSEKGIEHWPGAFYYSIREFGKKEDKMYLVFGYHAYRKTESYKLVDILRFDEYGKPVFGAPVFVIPESDKEPRKDLYRYPKKYASNSNFVFNYDDEKDAIVFDNLMLVGARMPGEPPVEVPDGTYSTFRYKKGKWIYTDYLFEETSDTPIDAVPLFDDKE